MFVSNKIKYQFIKEFFVPLIAFAMGISVTAILSWKNNDENVAKQGTRYNMPNPDSRPIIALRKLKLKSGISAEEIEKYAVKLAHKEYGKIPGAKEYIAKGERGDEVGNYIYVTEFDSKITRDFYYPFQALILQEHAGKH
jgi:hypothetical protein